MLVEIRCEQFRNGPIRFHKGLNAVIGDSDATNSIGKSSLLMIIDFAHGGDGYIKYNIDTVKELGHHAFYITHAFNDKLLYFIRDTSQPDYVRVCNSEFTEKSVISNYRYNEMLKDMYGLGFSSESFRELIGRYSRVWGKNNYFIDKPLHGFMNANAKESILSLVHIFGLYDEIAIGISRLRALEAEMHDAKEARKALKIQKLTKSQHNVSLEKIKVIENSIDDIKNNLAKFAINLKQVINEEVIRIKTQKDVLLDKRYDITSKLGRIEQSLSSNRHITSKSFHQVIAMFEGVNKKRLEEIELFHSRMSQILKKELLDGRERLILQLEPIDQELALLDRQLSEATKIDNPSIIVDHTIELLREGGQLRSTTQSYELIESLTGRISTLKAESNLSLDRILAEISFTLNDAMKTIVEFVYYSGHKAPTLSATSSGYQFNIVDDTGTGQAYSNIIVFDLAVFANTMLPLVMHDSHLFKNVQNSVISGFIKKYCEFDKQSFIALDEVSKYGDTTTQLLLSMAVARLSNVETLFKKDWRSKKPIDDSEAS